MNNASEKIAALAGQFPNPDPSGKMTGPDPAAAEKIFVEVLGGGRDNVLGLIGLLVEAGKGDDWKVRYLIHGLALYIHRPEGDKYRGMFVEALSSQLAGDLPKEVKSYLLREIQASGDKQAVPAVGKLLTDEELAAPAAAALVAIRDGAAEQFRQALPQAQGKSRLSILQALGVLRDGPSLDALKKALDDEDREVRLVAAFGLANSADGGSADSMLKASDVQDTWERDQMTSLCLLLAEKLLAAGRKGDAVRIYQRLRDTRTKPEDRHTLQAATLGLAAAGA